MFLYQVFQKTFAAPANDLIYFLKGRYIIIVRVGDIGGVGLLIKVTVQKYASFCWIKSRGAIALGLDVFQIGFVHGDDVVKVGKIIT